MQKRSALVLIFSLFSGAVHARVPAPGNAMAEGYAKLQEIRRQPKSRAIADELLALVKSPDPDLRLIGLQGLDDHYCAYLHESDFPALYQAVKDAVVLPDRDGRINSRLMVEKAAALLSDPSSYVPLRKDLSAKDKGTRLAAAGVLSAARDYSIIPTLVAALKGADYVSTRELGFALYRLGAPAYEGKSARSVFETWWKKNKNLTPGSQGRGPVPSIPSPAQFPADEAGLRTLLMANRFKVRLARPPERIRHFSDEGGFCRNQGFYAPAPAPGKVNALYLVDFQNIAGRETARIYIGQTESLCPAKVEAVGSPHQPWFESWRTNGLQNTVQTLGWPVFNSDHVILVPLFGEDGKPNLWFAETESCGV